MPEAHTSTASSGKGKRKRPTDGKFYAVRTGRRPGVYSTWDECQDQVKGYKLAACGSVFQMRQFTRGNGRKKGRLLAGLTFCGKSAAFEECAVNCCADLKGDHIVKSFATYEEARKFVKPVEKFYAVRSGKVPGIYSLWSEVQEQIEGFSKPLYRLFLSLSDAEDFMNGKVRAQDGKWSPWLGMDTCTLGGTHVDQGASNKKNKKSKSQAEESAPPGSSDVAYDEKLYEPGEGPLPPGSVDGYDHNIFFDPVERKIKYKSEEQRQSDIRDSHPVTSTGPIKVWTDGSSLNNGNAEATAGVGVYFGPRDARNISARLEGSRQTNQRAELTAILKALDHTPRNRNLIIATDSQYSINCATKWNENWRRNGWKNAQGKPVENKDLIKDILAKMEHRQSLGFPTSFQWTKGHATDEGNIQADLLANHGARMP